LSEQEKVLKGHLEEPLHRQEDIRTSLQHMRLEYAHLTNRCAPVSALPDEILAIIFGMGRKYDSLNVKASHVIRRWRDVAINTPLLWTRITVSLPQSLDQAETYLKRSQNCSLDIELNIYYPHQSLPQNKGRCLDCFLPHVGRWRKVEISACDEQCAHEIISQLLCLSAPRLQRFALCNVRAYLLTTPLYPHHSPLVRIFTGGAGALERFKLSQLSMAQCWPPLAAVTWLDFYFTEPLLLLKHFHDALRAMTHLTDLRILGKVTEFLLDSEVVQINLPSLVSLYFDCTGDEDYSSAMFATLCMPSLRSLTLEEMFEEVTLKFAEHLQTPSHSPKYPMLRSIGFRECDLDPPYDIDLISLLPTITHLCLQNHYITFVEQLALKSSGLDGHFVCPHLHTVTIGESLNSPGLASVCNLISVRKSINLPITTLYLVDPYDSSRFDWLRDNVCLMALNRENGICSCSWLLLTSAFVHTFM
jgi:hypothetical protein